MGAERQTVMTNRIVLEGGNIFKDMTGQTCQKCKKDKYQERSQHDDMDGKVTCSCGNRVDRWKKYKEQGVAEGSGMTNRIVLEGGNIFKDEDGTPVTQRINRADVDPTLAWIEKITGIPHKDFKLGSTGIRATSGDMDIAVNQAEVDKADLYNKLAAWAQKNHPDDDVRQWVAKSGISVHFKTPINGDPEQGYVQTDLMFGDPEWMKFTLKGAGDDTPYKGVHRNILIASVAKGLGFKFSPKDGLVNRETGDVVSNNPDQIAEILLGPGNKRDALDSVESIIAKLKSNPDYDKLTADAREYFARENLTLPESVTAKVGTTDWFSQLSERLK